MKIEKTKWPIQTKELAVLLHSKLSLTHKNWHHRKGDSETRAAELLSAAIVQLLQDGKDSEIIDLIEHSLGWLKGEVKDPGCPHN